MNNESFNEKRLLAACDAFEGISIAVCKLQFAQLTEEDPQEASNLAQALKKCIEAKVTIEVFLRRQIYCTHAR